MLRHVRRHAALVALLLLAALLLLVLNRPLIRGDGVAYLAWLDTLVLDRDLDFGNQLTRLAPVNSYQIQWNPTTNRLVNIFPFGVVIFQAPFFALGHWFALNGWWDANPDYFHAMQGLWRPYSVWLMIGANVLALATLLLSYRLARALTAARRAAFVCAAVLVGTPLIYYATVSPLNSHLPGALAYALFLVALLRIAGGLGDAQPTDPGWQTWLLLGVASGLMVLARWQLLLVAAPAWPLFARPARWRGWALATLAAGIVCLPLPLVWQHFFGQPFVVPYDAVNATAGGGAGAFLTLPRNAGAVLLQTIAHSPLIALSLLGLVPLWRRDRRWALYAGLVIALQLYVNGGVLDWWAGETYGMRRMSELFALYVVLLSALPGRAPRGIAPNVAQGAVALLAVYSLCYIVVFVNYTWTNGDGVFINDPSRMWQHFMMQPDRWAVTWAVWRAHLGPWAWALPGP